MQSVLHHCHLYHVSMCNSWQIHPSICPCVCPMLVLFLSESIYCPTSMPVCQGIISVFIEPHHHQKIPRGTLLSGGIKYTTGRILPLSLCISRMVQDRPMVAVDQQQEVVDSRSSHVSSSDLERQDTRGQNFLVDLHNYTHTVLPRMTEFGMLTQAGGKHIQGSSTY